MVRISRLTQSIIKIEIKFFFFANRVSLYLSPVSAIIQGADRYIVAKERTLIREQSDTSERSMVRIAVDRYNVSDR